MLFKSRYGGYPSALFRVFLMTTAFTVLFILSLYNPLWGSDLEKPGEITILNTSDYHFHQDPFDCASGTSMGGYAHLKGYYDPKN